MTPDRDKTWAEKIPLATCRCTHVNTLHAGSIGACAFLGCKCQGFKERHKSELPVEPKTFQDVQEIMQGGT